MFHMPITMHNAVPKKIYASFIAAQGSNFNCGSTQFSHEPDWQIKTFNNDIRHRFPTINAQFIIGVKFNMNKTMNDMC